MKFALERHNFPKKNQFFSSKKHIARSNCANPLQSRRQPQFNYLAYLWQI